MAKEDTKVHVEMTEKQKEKVTEFMAKEKEKENPSMIEVDLRFEHQRNSKKYGPGKVIVEEGLGSSLFVADYKAYLSRLNEMESNNSNIHILARGVSKITHVKGT